MRQRITFEDRIKENPENLLCQTKKVGNKVKFYLINKNF